eukprot:PLAT6166.1.p1 GENE.PLAT6166.1~~PLAT6166.1.p1  ORF type:complete len:293 (-),score=81.93 PLAT6166.1:102-860(-)
MELSDDARAWCTPHCLLRYCRARSFKLADATALLEASLAWREEFGPTELAPEEVEAQCLTGKIYQGPVTDSGEPLVIMTPARENTKDHDGQLKNLVWQLEHAISRMPEEGTGSGKLVLVIDYTGYSLSNAPPMKTSRASLDILSNQYPERLAVAYMVNAPFLFWGFWNLISPFINSVTKEKIKFVSSKDLPEVMSHHFADTSVLETRLGGESDFEYVHDDYWATVLADYESSNHWRRRCVRDAADKSEESDE